MDNNAIIKGRIESLAFGGQGILRHEGMVIFIPFTAPGDLVTCRLIHKKRSYAVGELLSIDQPSPLRVEQRCPYFGTCGGCQLQHLNYQAQLDYKKQAVADALERIAKINVPSLSIVPARQNWEYRRHINLKLHCEKGKWQAGYTAVDNRTLLPVECCPIFIPESTQILKQLQAVVSTFTKNGQKEGKVTLLKQQEGTFLLHFHFKVPPSNAEKVIEEATVKWKEWSGAILSSPKKTRSFGKADCTLKIEDLQIHFSPQAFIQNHPEQSLNIYKQVAGLAKEVKADKVLDLYCGIGCTSLMLGKQGCQVVGIESNKEAVRLAKLNAEVNSMPKVAFVQADAAEALQANFEALKPNLVIVNPPRIGLDPKVIESLLIKRPNSIVYISCMPSTLARDLQLLMNEGNYKLSSCTAYDMFPQTAHVETVVLLTK